MDKQPIVYIPSEEDKKKAMELAKRLVKIISESDKRIEFKAFVMGTLIESFDEVYNVDLKRSIMIEK